jgi:hypothetical protein
VEKKENSEKSRPRGKEILGEERGVSKEVRQRLVVQPLNGIVRCGFSPLPRVEGGAKW